MMLAFVVSQVILVPILGLMLLGIRNERLRLQRLLIMAIQSTSRRTR